MPAQATTAAGHRWMAAAAGWYIAHARPMGTDPETLHVKAAVYPVVAWEITHGQHGPTSGKPVIARDGQLVTIEPDDPTSAARYVEVTRIPGTGRNLEYALSDLRVHAQRVLENRRWYVYGGGE